MSRSGLITTFFGDGEHAFKIGVGETEELDEKFGIGLMEVQAAIVALRVPVIREVLRVGLIGGGMPRKDAHQLVGRHVESGYFLECAEVAVKVVEAAAKGVPDDMPGEGEGEAAMTPPSPTDA